MARRSKVSVMSDALIRAKLSLCIKFEVYRRTHSLSQRELAEMTDTDESVMSKILHHKIDEFTTDFLVNKLLAIYPNLDLYFEDGE